MDAEEPQGQVFGKADLGVSGNGTDATEHSCSCLLFPLERVPGLLVSGSNEEVSGDRGDGITLPPPGEPP